MYGYHLRMTACEVNGCERPAKTRNWCHAHYMRWWYTGDVDGERPFQQRGRSFEATYWANVAKAGPDDCWEWTASRTRKGYGSMTYKHKYFAAHRVGYELGRGAIPAGLTIDHLCLNKACVNPAHLEAVTRTENLQRRYALQTHCKRGHEFTPENTDRHSTTNARVCKQCARDRGRIAQRKYRAERKARQLGV